MRTEGIYTYLCGNCGVFFAVVARFSMKTDYTETLRCPKCNGNAVINGEGHVTHQAYVSKAFTQEAEVQPAETPKDEYPMLLTVDHVSKIMGKSRRVSYEIMDSPDFPLIKIRRSKRVDKESFFEWLKQKGLS